MDKLELTKPRIQSIDLLRGVVMVIMALDHSRDFFHFGGFAEEATDLATTTPVLFFTRWITHFCAPVFIFLSGASIYLMRSESVKEKSLFVFKRGLWLIILSLTVVAFAWWFDPSFHYLALDVIWVIGLCMILFAAIMFLPFRAILAFGLISVAFHNTLDMIYFENGTVPTLFWDLFHREGLVEVSSYFSIFIVYPLMPWIGVMSLGYCLGKVFQDRSPEQRRRILLIIGISCILLFGLLRSFNGYGDPERWSQYSPTLFSLMSFINTTKYPPSLLYLLMTLGPSLIFLALTEGISGKIARFFIVFGRVPLFFYLVHLYLLHTAALIATLFLFSWSETTKALNTIPDFPPGYGFGLPVVYAAWIATVLILYPLCSRYNNFKSKHQYWWLSYV